MYVSVNGVETFIEEISDLKDLVEDESVRVSIVASDLIDFVLTCEENARKDFE